MRKRIATVFNHFASMSLLLTTGLALAGSPAPAIAPEPSSKDPMPERILTFTNGVSVSTDITYSAIRGYRPITLDLYRPEADGQRPLVVYVHGGAWIMGHPRQLGAFSDFTAVLADLAARGYIVASLEYRLALEAPFPALAIA